MKVIGITGGVGSGKSYVAMLVARNFPVVHINTDEIARRQMQSTGESYKSVVECFGSKILGPDGEIDRSVLAGLVFGNDEKIKLLNSITHPNVTTEVKRLIEEAQKAGIYKAVLIETAILIEAGYDSFCDEIWYVHADMEDRKRRLKESRGYSADRIESIVASQRAEEEYRKYATAELENSDNISEEELICRIGELLG